MLVPLVPEPKRAAIGLERLRARRRLSTLSSLHVRLDHSLWKGWSAAAVGERSSRLIQSMQSTRIDRIGVSQELALATIERGWCKCTCITWFTCCLSRGMATIALPAS